MTHDNSAIVTAFCREFDVPAPDPGKLGAYFTEDAVYHNIPMAPVSGRAAIEAVLGGMAGSMLSSGWEVKHQVATGDVVMNERVDRFKVGDKTIAIPVMGVFELRDGKIAAWRDYFDLAMWQKQMA
jgi:limonene-1,2-epoxide hydrolase